MKAETQIGWNVKYLKAVKKEKFIKDHSDAYPGHDLAKVWDEHNPPKDAKK